MFKEYPKTETILRLLAGGVVLTALFLNPHFAIAVASVVKSFDDWRQFPRHQLRRNIDRLRKRKLVHMVERNNESVIELTDLGKQEILRYDISNMQIIKPSKWDGKWRMVIFDIPENIKRKRNIFQSKLKELGFYFIQKSVCLHPFPCKKEIEFLREVYGIKREVNYLLVEYFEEEYKARKKFNM